MAGKIAMSVYTAVFKFSPLFIGIPSLWAYFMHYQHSSWFLQNSRLVFEKLLTEHMQSFKFLIFQILNVSGNQDRCYYNFKCAHPFGVFSGFNFVYSNMLYVLLGLLFIAIVTIR